MGKWNRDGSWAYADYYGDKRNEGKMKYLALAFLLLTMAIPVLATEDKFEADLDIKKIIDIKPVKRMIFYSEKEEVGYLDWDDGTLKFGGNMEESARVFFEYFWKNYVEPCQQGSK